MSIPESVYGVLLRDEVGDESREAAEAIRRIGYAIIDSRLTQSEIGKVSDQFQSARQRYTKGMGEDRLRRLDEINTIRSPLALGDPEGTTFMKLAMNESVLQVLRLLIVGKFVLNQQNGIINPAGHPYNQGHWHRDLPYQHFISSSPLAINALYCVDDFSAENGATFVLPASHKEVTFPSVHYVQRHAIQVEAKAGQYILLDCMMFHAGGSNRTSLDRRAVNHVYTIPYFKQQIRFSGMIREAGLNKEQLSLLGFDNREPCSVEDYLSSRER